jgi:predicted ATPase
MITKLKIANFKSHKDTELAVSNLTVLTGVNSSGKSSVLQSLLLLRQSFKKSRLSEGLDLNDPLCKIGFGEDAISRFATENHIISFLLEGNNNEKWDFQFNVEGKYDDTFIPKIGSKIIEFGKQSLGILFSNDFQYISSSRWANINSYPADSYAVKTERQLSIEYGQGELVANFLNYYGETKNFQIESDLLLHPNNSSRNLLEQVIEWEREISPRIGITAKPIQSGKFEIKYEYKGGGNSYPIRDIKTKNVGFGISYSLPVVVALLSAKPGALLIIENPEAHLHPRGQSRLAELMTFVAQSGVQIFVETHSDHIFNGIRKAISQKKIDNNKVKVHFFELNEENISISTEIQFSDNGRILNDKKGLFDQFDNDLDELLGL